MLSDPRNFLRMIFISRRKKKIKEMIKCQDGVFSDGKKRKQK